MLLWNSPGDLERGRHSAPNPDPHAQDHRRRRHAGKLRLQLIDPLPCRVDAALGVDVGQQQVAVFQRIRQRAADQYTPKSSSRLDRIDTSVHARGASKPSATAIFEDQHFPRFIVSKG